jgi:hypothetical protein
MQNPIRIGSFGRAAALGLAVATLATGANAAILVARATLTTAVSEVKEADLEGIHWRCEGTACTGTVENSGSRRPPAMTACRTLSAEVGQVATFERAGIAMSSGNVAHCNEAAGH